MRFIEKHLLDGETIVYQAKVHWWIFFTPIALLVFGGYLLTDFIALNLTPPSSPARRAFLQEHDVIILAFTIPASFALLCCALYLGLRRTLTYLTREIGISNRRLLIKEGFIRRRRIELMLDKVEQLHVYQPIIGRIFGFGSIAISGAGTSEIFELVAKPFVFREKFHEQMDAAKTD